MHLGLCISGAAASVVRPLRIIDVTQTRIPSSAATPESRPYALRHLALPAFGIAVVILLSNVLVQFPISRWLTWGAFVYPVGYWIVEVSNQWAGPKLARRVAWIGFASAAVLSALLATPRIAVASSSAFITSQLLDISVFNRLRRQAWWRAPLVASMVASIIDTTVFFFFAFYGTKVQWIPLAIGDLGVKLLMAVVMLIPFGLVFRAAIKPSSA